MTPSIKSIDKAFKTLDMERFVKIVSANVIPNTDVRFVAENEAGNKLTLPWTITPAYTGTAINLLEIMAAKIGSDLGRWVELGDTDSEDPLLQSTDGLRKRHSLRSMSEVRRVAHSYEVVLSDLELRANKWENGETYLVYNLRAELKKKDL